MTQSQKFLSGSTGRSRSLEVRYPIEPSFLNALAAAALAMAPVALLWFLSATSLLSGPWTQRLATSRLFTVLCGHWVCPLILWFAAAAVLYLRSKLAALNSEMATTGLLLRQVLPRLSSDPSAPRAGSGRYLWIETVLQQMAPGVDRDNLLLRRCRAVFADQSTSGEASGTEVEQALMQGSYALPRYTVWAIPMLGLIGTVIGISEAVSHFAQAMSGSESATGAGGLTSALQQHLPRVTGGLASAFDATFLALLLSLPVMLLITWLEKREEGYLLSLDSAWQRDVLPLLGETKPEAAPLAVATPPAAGPIGTELTAELQLLSLQVRALQETISVLGQRAVNPPAPGSLAVAIATPDPPHPIG